jgi:hypothetical protein
MPRPIKDDPRDCFKTFRFTEAEIARLEARARATGRTLSSYVRMAVLDGHGWEAASGGRAEPEAVPVRRGRKRQAHPLSAEAAGLPGEDFATLMLAEQMRRVGVNLNQIAKRMNEQRIPPPRELTRLLAEIRAYVRQVNEP